MSRLSTELSHRDRESPAAADVVAVHHEDEPAPVGTLFLMMLFLVAIAGLWGTLYWMLLTR
jgi:hypothetical protein